MMKAYKLEVKVHVTTHYDPGLRSNVFYFYII